MDYTSREASNMLAIHGFDAEFIDRYGQMVLELKQEDGSDTQIIRMSLQEARMLAEYIYSELGPKYA